MARADEHLERYKHEVVALRQYDHHDAAEAATYASTWASFSAGFMFGAGFPAAAATVAHLYRKAYPGAPFPVIWEGEV